jgi:hypothetical protein
MIEVLADLFGPGLKIMVELRADVSLVVEPHRRLIGEFPLQPVDFVQEIFFPKVRIHVEDFHFTPS